MAPIATLMDKREFRPDPGSKTRGFRHTTQGLRIESSIRLIPLRNPDIPDTAIQNSVGVIIRGLTAVLKHIFRGQTTGFSRY
jgi:hypothetical protein